MTPNEFPEINFDNSQQSKPPERDPNTSSFVFDKATENADLYVALGIKDPDKIKQLEDINRRFEAYYANDPKIRQLEEEDTPESLSQVKKLGNDFLEAQAREFNIPMGVIKKFYDLKVQGFLAGFSQPEKKDKPSKN